ncbi:MAG: PAS domain S-box protein [Chloroflexi bacterium]|nr:PAS domain S-box protein [Chloroflexota bacterium]
MTIWLRSLANFLPPRLTTRIMLGLILIVVSAGIVTTLAINQILARSLREELSRSGRSMTTSLGESLANALIEGNLASIQEILNTTINSNSDIIYVFAYGPKTPVIHTFPNGFPRDLLSLVSASPSDLRSDLNEYLVQTANGIVHDFVYYPLDGVSAEVHVGISENRILAEQWRVTQIVLALTALGCALAAGMTYGFSRLATYPLVDFTRRVQRLGQGYLDERISLSTGDEIGELAQAFNIMADEIQSAIQRLRNSEVGYRTLLSAAGDVGEGIALISDEPPGEGNLLFVNETFARLTGFESQDLIGMNVSSVLHPDSIELARKSWQSIRGGAIHSESTELTLTDRHGNQFIVETASTMIEYQGQQALVWFTRDITDRKHKERELRLRNRELLALNAVASALNEPYSPNFIQRALHETLQALELDIGWVTLLRSNERTEIVACEGFDLEPSTIDFPNCVCSQVLRTGQPALVEANEHCALKLLQTTEIRRMRHATIPLGTRDKTFGVLSVAFPLERPFDEHNFRLLSAIGKQIGIALENAGLWDELQEKERLRAELLAKAIQVQEDERRRIARELHDETGQSLNAMVFGLKAAEAALSTNPAQAREVVARLKSAAGDTVRELQTIIYDLRPSLLDDLGLTPALRWYAETRLESEGVRVIWNISGVERRLSPEVETALFRIGQEAITNIAKYASAGEVDMELLFEENRVVLTIKDDGSGFDIEDILTHPIEDGRGLGLLGMRERVELLRGKFEVASTPGSGTYIRAELPVQNSAGE